MKLLVSYDKSYEGVEFLYDLVHEEITATKAVELLCSEANEAYLRLISKALNIPLVVIKPSVRGEVSEIYKELNIRLVESCHRALLLYDGKSKIMSELLTCLNVKSKKYRVVRYKDLGFEKLDMSTIQLLDADETMKRICMYHYGLSSGSLVFLFSSKLGKEPNHRLMFLVETTLNEILGVLTLQSMRETVADCNISGFVNAGYAEGSIFSCMLDRALEFLSTVTSDNELYIRCPRTSLILRKVLADKNCKFIREDKTPLNYMRYYMIEK